jgi:hypothetical protein
MLRFVSRHGWWPTSPEIAGGRVTSEVIRRELVRLEAEGLVCRDRRAWRVTEAGFSWIGADPVCARYPRRPDRRAWAEMRALREAAARQRRLDAELALERGGSLPSWAGDLPIVE